MPVTALKKNTSLKFYSVLKDRVRETLLAGQRQIERQKLLTYWNAGKLINEHEELAKLTDPKIILPLDTNPAEGNALDIGPKAIAHYCEIIRTAKFVIWNGPMGKYEDAPYADGTKALAEAIASAPRSIIGGGDTIAAVNALVPSAKFTYISTGGGAMLEFLAGKRLPALEALGYYGQ